MLYFQFNTDNVVALKKNRVGDNQSISEFYIEGSVFALGDIKEYFFQKLHRELGLDGIGMNPAFYAMSLTLSKSRNRKHL